jgi:hypothetical protein
MALKRNSGARGTNRTISQVKTNGHSAMRSKKPNQPIQKRRPPPLQFEWTEAITPDQWDIYSQAINAVRNAGVPFMLGGGFALAMFTGRWRDTKDIDFYIHPRDQKRAAEALTNAGFKDYYSERAYERHWIYRSTKEGFIVDMIWAMANQRAEVDEQWFEHASSIRVRDQDIKILPMEEFMWCKLYIMQRDHCDWTDLFNLLYANAPALDWRRLIGRLEEDRPLLRALLGVYGWLCPKAVGKIPSGVWRLLDMPKPRGGPYKRNHIRLLDSRGWFSALQPAGQKLQV